MVLATQIPGFQIKYISKIELIFCMLKHGVRKAKSYFGYAHGQIWLWPFRSWDSKICYVSRINWWIELIFYMLEVM